MRFDTYCAEFWKNGREISPISHCALPFWNWNLKTTWQSGFIVIFAVDFQTSHYRKNLKITPIFYTLKPISKSVLSLKLLKMVSFRVVKKNQYDRCDLLWNTDSARFQISSSLFAVSKNRYKKWCLHHIIIPTLVIKIEKKRNKNINAINILYKVGLQNCHPPRMQYF